MPAAAEAPLAVLLAGGEGRRLHPLTSPARPKPCLRVADGKPLLEQAFERASALAGGGRVWAVASAREHTRLSCAAGLFDAEGFIAEPAGRNTAAAAALACAVAEAKVPDSTAMALIPSDHVFEEPELFVTALREAVEAARAFDGIVLMGTSPRSADPNYGYIQVSRGAETALEVARFVEKPPLRMAARCMSEGWLWNLGVFVFRVETALAAFERCAPFALEAAREALQGSHDAYLRLAPESFDRLVVEHSPCRAVTLPPEAGWFDLGTWASMREYLERKTGRRFLSDEEACTFLLDFNL
jgi:mannose-1-phosphate guanylyltransferase